MSEQGLCFHGDVDGPGHPYSRPYCPARQVLSNAALGIERRDQDDLPPTLIWSM